MIYIITGIAKAGKSLIAKEMNRQYHIPYMSTDYILMMLHNSKLHDSLDIDASDTEVANQIEPYVEGMIKSMIDNDESFIIEGVHFNTDFSEQLLQKFSGQVEIVYLGFKDQTVEAKLEELNKYESSIKNKWYQSMNEEDMKKLVTYLVSESNRVYEECQEHHLHYIEVYNVVQQQNEIIGQLLKKDHKM